MSNDNVIRALTLFNEKADKLMRLSFVQEVMNPDVGFTISWQVREDGYYDHWSERRGPNEEAVDAFVLTFRFFIQDNEQSSLHMLAEHYQAASIRSELREKFVHVRSELNRFLDQPSSMVFTYQGEVYTRRKIMDTFIYGGLAHANREKKQRYDEWTNVPPIRVFLEAEFVDVLTKVLRAIVYLKALNVQVLSDLSALSSQTS